MYDHAKFRQSKFFDFKNTVIRSSVGLSVHLPVCPTSPAQERCI